MTEISFDIIGFDLDGTLLDTSMELAASLNYALETANRPQVDAQSTRSLVGMGARHMLKMALQQSGGFDDNLVNSLLPVLIDHYSAHLGTNAPAFPGLINALEALQQREIKLAVVTNKFENLAVKLLTNVGLIHRFVTVIGGDTMGKGRSKPKRDPIDEMIRRCDGTVGQSQAAFIGDSLFDIEAAKNAEITNIAVSFGFLHQPVEELGADAIIDHYDELLPTLAKLST